MVYFINETNPYNVGLGCAIFDDPRERPLWEMSYLHPETVDIIAGMPNRVKMIYGYPVVAEGAPKKVRWNGGSRKLPEVLMHGSVMIVCERLRNLIEQFDPGRHQLIPVDIYKNKKKPPEARYYWLNFCVRLDSVDHDKTTWVFKTYETGRGSWIWESGETHKNLIFSRAQIGNHHLWIDQHLSTTFWCSHAFGDAAKAAGFTGLLLNPFNEI
jgi:hypothetical protein